MNRVFRMAKYTRYIKYLTIPCIMYMYNTPLLHSQSIQQMPIQLTQSLFIQDILGNRQDYFFLIIYKEEVDGGLGEREAIQVAKQLSNTNSIVYIYRLVKIYTISRPSLTQIQKVVQRVKGVRIFDDEASQAIEIYFKTPNSDDYVYIPFRKDKFYKPYKQDKIMNKVNRFQKLVQVVKTEEELCNFVLENYYQLDAPIFIRTNTTGKQLKYFNKMAFQFTERKWTNLNAKYLVIDNKELQHQLRLNDDDVLMLRNDILQKYKDSQVINGKLVTKLSLSNVNKQELIGFVADRVESYQKWRNIDSTQTPLPPHIKYNEFGRDMQQFVLPRVVYLNNGKRSHIANMITKIQHCKIKDQLVLSLHIDPRFQSRIDYQQRLQVFFQLYEKYKKYLVFMISATDELEELMPHLNKFHSNFTLFNVYNQQTSNTTPLFDKVTKPYEKYFLRDDNLIEGFSRLEQQIQSLLGMNKEDRVKQMDYISQDQDRIQEINLAYYQSLQNSTSKHITLYYQNDILTDAILQVLKDISVEINANIYTMSKWNQIPDINRQFNGQNVLIVNQTAIGMPTSNGNVNLTELREIVNKLIIQYI